MAEALDRLLSPEDGVEHLHVHVAVRAVRLTLYLAGCDLIDAAGRALAIALRLLGDSPALAGFVIADFNVLGRPPGPQAAPS
ncbi:hypothetical protein ACIPLC_02660 [Kitasatospora sp. NPDC086801]|uniref:hypothetical protein n=1 Tax=Kitasatospora sp. NPDC086801 TaxID=3364066 RepID=UPI0037F1A00E